MNLDMDTGNHVSVYYRRGNRGSYVSVHYRRGNTAIGALRMSKVIDRCTHLSGCRPNSLVTLTLVAAAVSTSSSINLIKVSADLIPAAVS